MTENDSPRKKTTFFWMKASFAHWMYTPENWTCWKPRNIGGYRVCMEGFPTLARVISKRAWWKRTPTQTKAPIFLAKEQNSRHPVCHIPSLTLTLAPENGWLELLLFLVGRPIFRDYVSFEGKVFHTICMNFNFSHTWVPSSKLTGRCNDSISPLFET